MLSNVEYIKLSLDLNLFFLRIMKEHAIFLEAAFTTKDKSLAQTASYFKQQFEYLLRHTVLLSPGSVGRDAIETGQYVTPFTLRAEQMTQYYTGIPIDSSISADETSLGSMSQGTAAPKEDQVYALNSAAMTCLTAFIAFKTKLLNDVASCRLFMNTYWLLLDHILREARFYYNMLMKLQTRTGFNTPQDLAMQEAFWNQIMAEHSKFIRGLLDPTEETLFQTANMFGNEFDELTVKAKQAQNNLELLPDVTAKSLDEAKRVSSFNAAGTGGLLDCKIKAIIVPLLGDHVLREANHFIHVLQTGVRG
jgi:hypothetical protein